jgi:gamma-glutamylcyclotransferase (GGCT)/AIG2-like uncharacterized protein YtfP
MSVFFVYGTLMRGFRNQQKHLPDHAVEKVVRGYLSVDGFLVHFEQGFPGLFYNSETGQDIGSHKTIAGELVYVKDEYFDEVTRLCDGLEEYFGPNDPRNLYRKETVSALDENKNTVSCQTYICLLDPFKRSVRVEGDPVCWRTHMEANNLDAAASDWASK